MANFLWGKIFYKSSFAGYLRQEPGERYSFTYDETYLESNNPPIAYRFPLRPEPYFSEQHIHPIKFMERRWRGTFSLTGRLLSKKP